MWCALARLGQSATRVKIWGGSTPKGRNVVCRKMSDWVGQYEQLKRFCLRAKVYQFFSPNVEGVVVDKILFGFAMYGSVPEIFAIKFESCQKSRRILDVFSHSHILGGRFSKSYTHFITPSLQHVERKKFCEDTPISPEVLFAHTLNFKPYFKLSRLKFFGGPPSLLGVR